ncbi:M24 family metallopeptidase [Asticcacaulis solisilvae]|uniref:M24 family metallopeptidase n=1 Tax=Asticcacaulis solisilvae TaxID=1217274 RepID=UPI003FD8B787
MSEQDRLIALGSAEDRAFALLTAIEDKGLIAPGRTEREVENDIYALAESDFGVEVHWHKRIVRAGANTLAIFSDNPPILTIADDDIVFVDIGPVFGEWEADVGRTYAIGNDPVKHALVRDQPVIFDAVAAHYAAHPDITGAELYAKAVAESEARGWRFAGEIAGHVVAEFPHARVPGEKMHGHIRPENPTRMRDLDGLGRARHWILEIHLAEPNGTFGGFYERLLVRAG